jgi:hypothetical protein
MALLPLPAVGRHRRRHRHHLTKDRLGTSADAEVAVLVEEAGADDVTQISERMRSESAPLIADLVAPGNVLLKLAIGGCGVVQPRQELPGGDSNESLLVLTECSLVSLSVAIRRWPSPASGRGRHSDVCPS